MNVATLLRQIVDRYPPPLARGQRTQINRFAYEISLVLDAVRPGGRVCDIGGGWGSVALGCAAAGLHAVLVDDFRDEGFFDKATMSAMRALYAEYGVEVVARDVVKDGLDFAAQSLDAVTCFDSMEHWHGSPREAFRSAVRSLRPRGLFVLATPNCVNLRKRITVPLGRGKWSALSDWYGPEVFRGHVREPDVDDLRFIARDLGLERCRVVGRNWNGYSSAGVLTRALTHMFDRLIRLNPALCSDLYLIGHAGSAP